MKGTKDDTAHEDVSTVLSTLKMLSAELNILVHPPKNHFIFGGSIFGSNYYIYILLVRITDDHFHYC